MRKNITLLDCTLRDGAHVVGGYFGEVVIKNTIKKLIEARVDVIEVGFLSEKKHSVDYTNFCSIADLKRILPPPMIGTSKISLMADNVDLRSLEPNDGTIGLIRLSFKRSIWDWAIKTAHILMKKGYKIAINPVNCNVYDDIEYIEWIHIVNDIMPDSFSIVDTFGVMRKTDLSRIYHIVENNLHPDITIGLHLHENLGLAYSLAQHFVEISNPVRSINIDCSLLGMGRTPGNLFTEHIMDFLNTQYGKNYQTEPAFDAADDYIAPIKRQNPWGYATPYALSAKYKLHRSYAEYLMEKGRLKTKDMQRILSRVDSDKAELFDEKYIENLYKAYMNISVDDDCLTKIKQKLSSYSEFVIVAPGASINQNKDKINEYIADNNACVIAINFDPDIFTVNFVFCTNIRRYDKINISNSQEFIITSNIIEDVQNYNYVIAYNNLVYHDDVYCDDSTLMLLNLLKLADINKVAIAGFDGYIEGKHNYYSDSFEKRQNLPYYIDKVRNTLKRYFSNMDIIFLTPSQFEKKF